MPNVDDLDVYLKKDHVKDGDILVFADAGKINEIDFSKKKDGSDLKSVLQIGMRMPDGKVKIWTANNTSIELIKQAFGKPTEEWVGKSVKVNLVKQMSFGKMAEMMVLVPVEK